jgi:hypothetical protein
MSPISPISPIVKAFIERIDTFDNIYGVKMTVSEESIEDLLALHGLEYLSSIEDMSKSQILSEAAMAGNKDAYTELEKTKEGRDMIEQIKIKKPA